jgi:hypothetical protein
MTAKPLVLLSVLTLGACTWVEPDAGGKTIRVAYEESATLGCVALGREVTVSVKHEIAGIARDRRKVLDELESLARNDAAGVAQADTVRALGPVRDGEQTYAVYDCR